MSKRAPILMSFYGLSNGQRTAVFGKMAYAPTRDLSFTNYSRFKTFKSVLALYRTAPVRSQRFDMAFNHGTISGQTDGSGSFWCETNDMGSTAQLHAIKLIDRDEDVVLTKELYPNTIQTVTQETILVSDLDDTLIDSFVNSKFRQLKTLLFTSVETRKSVDATVGFVKHMSSLGVATFYLSNSEQNLYPMLYRLFTIHEFPKGPLLLRQYVHLRNWAWRKIFRKENIHKRTMLEKIIELFPDRKFILLGDNTQHDLTVYLEFTKTHSSNVNCVIIRQATLKEKDQQLMVEAAEYFKQRGIIFYYGTELPQDLLTLTN